MLSAGLGAGEATIRLWLAPTRASEPLARSSPTLFARP